MRALERLDSLGRPLEYSFLPDEVEAPEQSIVDSLIASFDAAWMGGGNSDPAPVPAAASAPGGLATALAAASASATAFSQHAPAVKTKTPAGTMPMASKRQHEEDEMDARLAMLPMTPPPAHGPISAQTHTKLGSNSKLVAAVAKRAVTTTAPTGIKAVGAHATTKSEFSSVFFSPIPLSYLNGIARSESNDSFNVGSAQEGSVGSPDFTLRGGRLATAAMNSDWDGETENSPAAALDALSAAGGSTHHDAHAHMQRPSRLSRPGEKAHLASINEHASGSSSADTSLHAANHTNGTSPDAHASSGVPGTNGKEEESSEAAEGTSPSAAGQLLSTSGTKAPKPLAPPGLHPILSRPPAASPLSVGLALLPSLSESDLLQSSGLSIAAVASAKKPTWGNLRLVAGTAMIPHIDKVDKGGEDAYFICLKGLGAIGVADGVSGWAEEGIDPAEYSRSLMRYASEALEAAANPHGADPREVIRHAHQETVMAGSSTVCVAVMKPHGKMHVANLGDSGVRVIRDGRIIFASAAQQHMFNMPFQLSHPSIIESPDDADCADVTTHDMQPGDIVVLATDGLYDNVFDEEIAQICMDALRTRGNSVRMSEGGGDAPPPSSSLDGGRKPAVAPAPLSVADAEHVAMAIAHTANSYAQNPYKRTPWSVSAAETGMPWARFFVKGGGKMDDVTVVVAFIREEHA